MFISSTLGFPLFLVEPSSAWGVPVCPSSSPVHTHLFFRAACLWVSGSSTRHWSHSPRSTAHPATTPSGCASLVQHWTLHTAIVFFMTFLICYLLCSFLYSLLLKAYLISQEEFKSHPLHEAFPAIYRCCISLLALNASLRAEMMFHSYLYPQKQLSQCPTQNWSSINVCWLKFSLLYSLALLGTAWVVTMTVSKRQLYPSGLSALVLSIFMMCLYIVPVLCQKPSTLVIHLQSG